MLPPNEGILTPHIQTTECQSFYATIYVGLKEGYTGEVRPLAVAKKTIQNWVDRVGQCVTVTPTEYLYTNGNEPGMIVGFINYPRFPVDPDTLRAQVLDLAQLLLLSCDQMNLSIVFPDKTIMLSNQKRIRDYEDKKVREV